MLNKIKSYIYLTDEEGRKRKSDFYEDPAIFLIYTVYRIL